MSADGENTGPADEERPPEKTRSGRIAAVFADRCLVWCEGEEVVCSLRGRMKEGGRDGGGDGGRDGGREFSRGGTKPVVGDLVEMMDNPDGSGTVTLLHPRRSELIRRIADRKRAHRPSAPQVLAANVDLLVAVASVVRPPLRPGLLDRFLAAAALAGIPSMICITKLDLDEEDAFPAVEATYAPIGLTVIGTDIHRPETLQPLAVALRHKTAVLTGHSGVGKTSLLNELAGRSMAVADVGFHKDRGRHTTSTARLIPLAGGGFAIDSPGVREFGLYGLEPAGLAPLYPDFAPYLEDCGFRDCLHRGEPGCSLKAAVEEGVVSEARYLGYLKMLEELES